MNSDSSPLGSTASFPSAEHAAGKVIGRYTLLERLGEGGMGEVWVARQSEPVKRKVALKLIKKGMDSKAVLQRFEQERQALAVMDHPNIAKILDGGLTDGGQPYFVMELVSGATLIKFCDDEKLSVKDRLELFVPICQAVQHAHQKGIIHRDLKPSNILVTRVDGKATPKIIDFGVAKAVTGCLTDETLSTQLGAVLGTLEYMAPEQAGLSTEDVDTRADVYSLGVILYELLTGLRPFDSRRLRKAARDEVLRLIREEDPPSLASRLSSDASLPSAAAVRATEPKRLVSLVRGELDWIARRCLEKDRNRRYETANALSRDVQRYLADEPVEARPVGAGYRLKKFVARNKGAVLAVGLVLLALVGGVAGATWGMIAARSAEQREAQRAEGERLAKINAQTSAAAEKEAKDLAVKRLAQVEQGSEILAAVFTDLDVRHAKRGGDPLEAVLAKRLVKAAERLEGDAVGDPLVVARLLFLLGRSLLNLGFSDEATTFLGRSFEMRKARLGPDSPETLASMSLFAAGLHAGNKPSRALPVFEEALKRQRASLGAVHFDTLQTMQNLGNAYRAARRLDLALPLLEENVRLLKDRFGPDDSTTLIAMGNLALGYFWAGKHDQAISLLEETLKRRRAMREFDHPSTLHGMMNLSMVLADTGNFDQTLPLLEEAVRLQSAKLGRDHPDTLMTMDNLAMMLHMGGRLDRALPIYRETLKLREGRLGFDHPDSIANLNKLVVAHREAGKIELALPLCEDRLKIRRIRLGSDHPETIDGLIELGGLFQEAGKATEAIPFWTEVAAVFEKQGFADPRAPDVIEELAGSLEHVGRWTAAESWRRKELATAKAIRSEEGGAAVGLVATGLARNLVRQEKWVDGESTAREAVALLAKVRLNSWKAFEVESVLGRALAGRKEFAAAEPLLKAGYEGMVQREKTIPSQEKNQRLAEAVDRLIELYTATDKPDEVKKWGAERAKYQAAQKPAAKTPTKATESKPPAERKPAPTNLLRSGGGK